MIQLISQLKGYFYINPLLALSLAITIFSFAGIPPLVGFFGKQMILSAALDKGYIFLALIAILTSVVGAVYYLNVIKEIFFYSSEYRINPVFEGRISEKSLLRGFIENSIINIQSLFNLNLDKKVKLIGIDYRNIVISSTLSITISIITLVVLLFIFMNTE